MPIGELSLLVVAGVDVVHQLCKAVFTDLLPYVAEFIPSAD